MPTQSATMDVPGLVEQTRPGSVSRRARGGSPEVHGSDDEVH